MELNKSFYRKLPKEVLSLLKISDGWLIGSSIEKIMNGETPKDYDIIVGNGQDFQKAHLFLSSLVCHNIAINSHGGIKISFPDYDIDIWVEELDHYLSSRAKYNYVFKFAGFILLKSQF